MKIGSFEGTPQELKDICENHGFKPEDFFEKPNKKDKPYLVYIFVLSSILTALFTILWTAGLNEIYSKILIIISLILLIFLVIICHLRFNNIYITVIILLSGITILSLSVNLITIQEALKEMRDLRSHPLTK
ncbi:hypothetical protein ASG01_08780 [Chryseobacterium sp. Leaf180]|uniref:hypothetical protein n=1 Tax=Chryseobacterium sp. Leaf180 TaxID=1736289 RepID=UPI0006FB3246|nr:hypothetical protein [Chryseobacterium sp. Leaf180]KQR93282.1 hypothetical protein ASG01_08780 [Chryseobacterium sp. Leaf180]